MALTCPCHGRRCISTSSRAVYATDRYVHGTPLDVTDADAMRLLAALEAIRLQVAAASTKT